VGVRVRVLGWVAVVSDYAEYLRIVREQEQRDRDRFTGIEHPESPMYSALTGQMAFVIDGSAVVPDLMDWWESLRAALEAMWQQIKDTLEAFDGLLWCSLDSKPKPAATRHSYPRKHGQWWNERARGRGSEI